MIIGADDAQPDAANPDQADYFNSSFLVGPDGALRATYKKQALVMFGEYLPLARWLPFLKWFTPIQGGFTPGTKPVPFHLADLDVTTSVLICYEDIFPQLGRRAAQTGADFLVNLTNDGWFGEGSAQWQQAVTAMFRTIENRVPLIRATNNGLTCWIDAEGRIREYFADDRGSIYGPGFLRVELPLAKHPAAGTTFYQRHGDWFGWSCVAWTVLAVAAAFRPRHGKGPPPAE
jgi:apolipoprotein N-acyltransferase